MTTPTGDRADRRAAWARPVAAVVATGPVVLALGVAVAWPGAGHGLHAWWPASAPAAVAVAVVASGSSLRGQAVRPLLLVGVLLAVGFGGPVARLLAERAPSPAVGWALADVAHAVVAGLVLASGSGLRLRTVPDVGRLAAAAVGGALVAGAIAVTVDPPALPGPVGSPFVEIVASRAAALLLLAPLAMRLPPRSGPTSRGVGALLWVLVLGTTAVVSAPWSGSSLMFLPAALLVVAALVQSPRTTTVQTAVVGVVLAGSAAAGAGPFGDPATVPDAVLPTFLAVVVVTVLLVVLAVAARDSALRTLDDRRRFDRAVLDGVSAGVLATDARGRVVLRNAAYRASTGDRSPDAGDAVRSSEQDLMARALDGEDLRGIHIRSGGDAPRELVADARPLRGPGTEVLGAVATFADVTDERVVLGRLREAITFHDAVLAASPDVIFITDVATHRVVWASGTVEPTLGYTPSQVVELDRAARLNIVHPDDVDALHETDDAAARLRDGEVRTVRVRMSNDRGDLRWMSRRVTPFTRDADGRVVQLLGVARDVTDVVAVEQRLTDAANRDPLTGLLNRRALLDRLGVLVARASDVDATPTPVLFCDLDGFKAVNDSLGHAAGDELLTTVAQRIVSSLRDGDTPARAGGDEFVLLLEPYLARPSETRADVLGRARAVARRILDTVSRPVEVQGARLAVTVSIGIALVRPGIGPGEVLRDADAAMYRAKATGKNRLHVFEVAPERGTPHRA